MAAALAVQPTDRLAPLRPGPAAPTLRLVPRADHDTLQSAAPVVGQTGVHSAAIALVPMLYGTMMLVMWLAFGGDLATALLFTVIAVFGILYFGLLVGGILVSDAASLGATVRSFRQFVAGRVEVDRGVTTGRDALIQILGLPVTLVFAAILLSIIARST